MKRLDGMKLSTVTLAAQWKISETIAKWQVQGSMELQTKRTCSAWSAQMWLHHHKSCTYSRKVPTHRLWGQMQTVGGHEDCCLWTKLPSLNHTLEHRTASDSSKVKKEKKKVQTAASLRRVELLINRKEVGSFGIIHCAWCNIKSFCNNNDSGMKEVEILYKLLLQKKGFTSNKMCETFSRCSQKHYLFIYLAALPSMWTSPGCTWFCKIASYSLTVMQSRRAIIRRNGPQ